MRNCLFITLVCMLLTNICDGQNLNGLWSECERNGEYTEFLFKNDSINIQSDGYKLDGVFKNKNDTTIYFNPKIGWDYLFVLQRKSSHQLIASEVHYKALDNHTLNLVKDRDSKFQSRRSKCRDIRTKSEKIQDSLKTADIELRIKQLELQLDSLRKNSN